MRQMPVSSTHRAARPRPALWEEAVTQAVADLAVGSDVRTAGDAVIAGAGLLGIDQKSEGAPPFDLRAVGDAEHAFRIGRPIDAVGGKIPAIGGLAHAGEDVGQVERLCG